MKNGRVRHGLIRRALVGLPKIRDTTNEGASMELDFVCGRPIDGKKSEDQGLMTDYNQCTYHFCSQECKEKFDSDPSFYSKLNFAEDEGEDLYTY